MINAATPLEKEVKKNRRKFVEEKRKKKGQSY